MAFWNATCEILIFCVPGSGPPALAGAPNDFETREEAEARVAETEEEHLKAHHTYLEIMSYDGDKADALSGVRY